MLVSYPHLMLTLPCGTVTDFGADTSSMVNQLHRARSECAIIGADAVALAGPQIGYPMRMFVWHMDDKDHHLLNPVLVEGNGAQYANEGCLSMLGAFDTVKNTWRKGIEVQVTRYERVVVRGQDLDGSGLELEAEGWLARVLQHEMDHLEGKVILNHVTKQVRKQALHRLETARKPYRNPQEAAQAAVAAERLRMGARARMAKERIRG